MRRSSSFVRAEISRPVLAICLFSTLSTMTLRAQRLDYPSPRLEAISGATRSEVLAKHGMACCSQPLATQAAIDVLRRGGNAIDAAIAANAVLCVVEPTGSGLGGDLFAMVWDGKTKKLYGLNGSGRSPAGLTLEALRAQLAQQGLDRIPPYGPLPVSVPGCVDAWFALHERFGKLALKEVFAEAIRTAKEGFPVTELIAYYWALGAKHLRKYPGFSEVFEPGGRAPQLGDIFRNPALAQSFERIVAGGRKAFYEGPIAKSIVEYLREQGGFLSLEDFARHHAEWVEPVSTSYRGHELWELPPNGQGLAAQQILNVLEGFDLRAMGFGSAEYIHHFVEAKKLAFEDRARFYGDPAFSKLPIQGLLSKKYAAKRRALIDPKHAAQRYDAGKPELEGGDTVYLCTADSEGNMVSLIQSNYRGMGSGMTAPGTGFVLQDRGELFDLEPGHPNSYAPAKRPFHTIIPAFVTRNAEPWLAFGVMGGAMQPQGHAQILINLVDFGMSLQEAGDVPRMRHEGSSQPTGQRMHDGGLLRLEPLPRNSASKASEVLRQLESYGQHVRISRGGFGGYQAIMRDAKRGIWIGASESRKDGQAAGY